MNITRIIKVFLASSIKELKDERRDISGEITDDLSRLLEQDRIIVHFEKCESNHAGNDGTREQDYYNQLLRGCDYSIFLFKTHLGDRTEEEYRIARELQKEGKHLIFPYFLQTPEESKEPQLVEFQTNLDIDWEECKNIEDVEKRFILGLLKRLGVKVDTSESDEIGQTGESIFKQFEDADRKKEEAKSLVHKFLDSIPEQIESIMSSPTESIAAKIAQARDLYSKADHWAAATAYDKEKYSNLLFGYADFLDDYGMYNDSEAIWLQHISLVEELHGTESVEAATSYNNIGTVYWKKGEYDKALEFYGKALEISEALPETEHNDTATTYNNIGTVYCDLHDYDKAMEYYFKAMEMHEKTLGKDHQDTATNYNNIGSVYDMQGDYEMALKYYFKALAIFEKAFSTENFSTAASYNNIGLVYKEQNDFGKALKYYFKALAILENVHGTEHPDIATIYDNIGMVYDEQGDYLKALEYYLKALAIRENVLSMEHPDIATSYNYIGALYYEQGDYPKALNFLNKAYQIRLNVLGPKHPYTKGTLELIELVKRVL